MVTGEPCVCATSELAQVGFFCDESALEAARVTTVTIDGREEQRSYHPECLRCVVTDISLDEEDSEVTATLSPEACSLQPADGCRLNS